MTPEQQAADIILRRIREAGTAPLSAAANLARDAVEAISAAELLIVPAGRMARLLELERGWQPMETAPLSTSTPTPHGPMVRAAYLLGFCPDESALDPQGCIEVIWWEPHLDGGRWQSAADVPIRPTHWMPLPEAPR